MDAQTPEDPPLGLSPDNLALLERCGWAQPGDLATASTFEILLNAARAAGPDNSGEQEPLPPSPDQLAMAFAAAMLANPKFDGDEPKVMALAWHAVPHFYIWRDKYGREIAPQFFVAT